MVVERLITELSELVMRKAKENYSNLMTKRFCYFGDLYETDNAAFTKMMEAHGQKDISSHFTRSQLSMTATLLFMEEIKAVTEMRLPLYSGHRRAG